MNERAVSVRVDTSWGAATLLQATSVPAAARALLEAALAVVLEAMRAGDSVTIRINRS